MARLLALIFVALFATSNAGDLLPASQRQQLVTEEGSPVHAIQSWSYEDYGLPTYPFQLDSISVFTDLLKPGENLTVTEQVEEGTCADISVTLDSIKSRIKLLQEQFDIYEEVRNANTSFQCPVEQGVYYNVRVQALSYGHSEPLRGARRLFRMTFSFIALISPPIFSLKVRLVKKRK